MAAKDGLPRYGSSGRGKVPFLPEACYGCFHGLRGSSGSSLEQAYAQMQRALSSRHGIYNKDRLLNRP